RRNRSRRRKRCAGRRPGAARLRGGGGARRAHAVRSDNASRLGTAVRCVTIPRARARYRRRGASEGTCVTELRRVRVDTHTHSEYSPDSRTPLAEQARAIRDAAIDIVCATDHNTIDGALRLREMADGFRVIVGEEIRARDGEI